MRRTDPTTPAEIRFRRLGPEQVPEFVEVLRGSYPRFVTDRGKAAERYRELIRAGYPQLIAGLDESGRVVGTYAFYTFVATVLGRGIPATGLGLVGTALHMKKQRVALQIVRDFVHRTRRTGSPLSFLYPFRHDFYTGMGWGAVCEMKEYRIRPGALPLYPERCDITPAVEPDLTTLDRIHREAVGARGALGLSRHPARWEAAMRSTSHVFLAGPASRPEGYILLRFTPPDGDADEFRHDLEVQEMEWTTPRAMRALLGFLSGQQDQVREISLLWPREGNLDAILREPVRQGTPHMHGLLGHGPVIGHGVMLRLEDPAEAFGLRPFAGADAVSLEVRTRDPLSGKGIRFRSVIRGDGAGGVRPRRAVLTAGLPALSRLWAGAMGFREAVEFGLVDVSPAPSAAILDRLFAVKPPWVVERF